MFCEQFQRENVPSLSAAIKASVLHGLDSNHLKHINRLFSYTVTAICCRYVDVASRILPLNAGNQDCNGMR